jgi:hypothetical protein
VTLAIALQLVVVYGSIVPGRGDWGLKVHGSRGFSVVLSAFALVVLIGPVAAHADYGSTDYEPTDTELAKYGGAALSWRTGYSTRKAVHFYWQGATDGCNGSWTVEWNALRLSWREESPGSTLYAEAYPGGFPWLTNCARSFSDMREYGEDISSQRDDLIFNMRFRWWTYFDGKYTYRDASTRYEVNLSGAVHLRPY